MSNLTLAVTTIGDLLLKNRITKGQDGKPIEDVHLQIPDYQRPYKWTARNAIQLLDDITEAKNNSKEVYRVGTLILHREDNSVGYNIVDGQQRTITFSLLLYAIYEELIAEGMDGADEHLDFLDQKVSVNSFNHLNIPNNLNAIRRRIGRGEGRDDYSEHKRNLKNLCDFIEKQCELIVVITNDITEAFQFFDSQNSRGKTLYPHDLLKAYHLREMRDIDADKTETIVKNWESIPQKNLNSFFGDYLYRVKEWINDSWAFKLDEQNIYKFKGITKEAHTPYAQFYKSAYSYAEFINSSAMPFVSGTKEVNAFQLNAPIVAGKPFFDFTNHYYSLLKDIRDNSKYEGFYVNDNVIVKTLDKYYNNGVGNRITRLLFDTSILVYIDRFCPATYPTKEDVEMFDQYVIYAFIWAYSLRIQYDNLGWLSAQNYILENRRDVINSLNIYKLISDSDTPLSLLSSMADKLRPIPKNNINTNQTKVIDENKLDVKDDEGVYTNYIHFFNQFNYL